MEISQHIGAAREEKRAMTAGRDTAKRRGRAKKEKIMKRGVCGNVLRAWAGTVC